MYIVDEYKILETGRKRASGNLFFPALGQEPRTNKFYISRQCMYIVFILQCRVITKMLNLMGTYKVRNEIETKRNETKRNQRKRNETKRNEINENETKRNEINEMETKWNETNESKTK